MNGSEDQKSRIPVRSENTTLTPARQLWTAWLSAAITIILFALTAKYALTSSLGPGAEWLLSSQSRTLLLLRVLSEATSLSLLLLLSSSIEGLQWMLITQERGLLLPISFSLDAGTGVLGLLQLVLLKGFGAWTRVSSSARLLLKLMIPVLAVLIMSDVEITMQPRIISTFPVSAGIGDLDTTQGRSVETLASWYAADGSNFLGSPLRTLPSESIKALKTPCPPDPGQKVTHVCSDSFFFTGGFDSISPAPGSNTQHQEADVYMVKNLRGYQFDFTRLDLGVKPDLDNDCNVFGGPIYAFQFCIWKANDETSTATSWNAKLINCPDRIGSHRSCLIDSSWLSFDGYMTNFKPYMRYADVIYGRQNRSLIAAHDNAGRKGIPAKINFQDITTIYSRAFNTIDRSVGESEDSLYFAESLSKSITVGRASTTGDINNAIRLLNLLALPFWYYQANTPFPNDTGIIDGPRTKIRPGLPTTLYTEASLAKTAYKVDVGRTTAILYIVGGAWVIFLCLAVLFVGSLSRFAARCPDTTSWPVLDFAVNCEVRDGDTGVMEDLRAVKGLEGKALRAALTKKAVVKGGDRIPGRAPN